MDIADRIIDLVRDPGCQLPDRGHFFGLQQLVLRLVQSLIGRLENPVGPLQKLFGAFALGLLRQPVLAPRGRLPQLALHCGQQAPEVVLADVIVRAALHQLHCGGLADLAGDDDEGQIEAPLLQNVQCVDTAEAGHRVIGNDDIPLAANKGRAHFVGALHAIVDEVVAAALQFRHQQLPVVVVVLDDKDVEQVFHL